MMMILNYKYRFKLKRGNPSRRNQRRLEEVKQRSSNKKKMKMKIIAR